LLLLGCANEDTLHNANLLPKAVRSYFFHSLVQVHFEYCDNKLTFTRQLFIKNWPVLKHSFTDKRFMYYLKCVMHTSEDSILEI